MKRAFAIRHVAFEDLGILAEALEAQGYSPAYLDAGVDDLACARPDRGDLLVVLGGPISAYEEDRYPFLRDELRLIEQCLHCQVPVLGICLGAQVIARTLGARVYPGGAKEIGFAPIELTAEGGRSCLRHLHHGGNMVLHWHGDTFDLPSGATRLASTMITPNQAFSAGDRVLALQFHIEADPRRIEQWLIGHACELTAAKIDVPTMRAQARQYADEFRDAGTAVLREWLCRLELRP
jgi:GMP synthase (glutamine-hydrolysing)